MHTRLHTHSDIHAKHCTHTYTVHTCINTYTHTHTYKHTCIPPHKFIHILTFMHSFIHSGHFYSAPSSPLLLRGAPDYSTDTVSEFHAEAHRQLQVKDLPKVSTWQQK